MKVGRGRVWIDPERLDEVETAITRREIERLIKDGAIQSRPERGVSRARAKTLHEKRRLGKRRGHGTRKGAKGARMSGKRRWISTIRAIRKKLKELRQAKAITGTVHRKLYGMAKGGLFKNSSHLLQYIETSGLFRRKPR